MTEDCASKASVERALTSSGNGRRPALGATALVEGAGFVDPTSALGRSACPRHGARGTQEGAQGEA